MLKDGTVDRAQVGIGTLIVFIAMVLVAAIAAGVLVDTAGLLQSTAESAGEGSVSTVTNRVDVVNSHGRVNDGRIETLNMTVRLSAGSGSVDMDNLTIKYLSDTTVATLSNGSMTNTADGDTSPSPQNITGNIFVTNVTKDADGSVGVLNTRGDRFEVRINASYLEDPDPTVTGLEPGERVRLEISSRTGGTSTVILRMPPDLAGKSTGDPVVL